MKVSGPRFAVEVAKTRAQQALKDDRQSVSARTHPEVRNARKQFSLRKKEDAGLIQIWHETILPKLTSILQRAIGSEYSACFAREGINERSAKPCIRIESPELPSKPNQTEIRGEIKHMLLEKDGFPRSRVHFSEGSVTCLGLEDEDFVEADSDTDDASEAEEHDSQGDRFAHEKHYWPQVGMGTSVGLLGSRGVSATSGGYILIDHDPYLLLPNHFIRKSVDSNGKASSVELDVVSPSLADVYDHRDHLKKHLEKHRKVSNDWEPGNNFMTVREIVAMIQKNGVHFKDYSVEDFSDYIQAKRLLEDVNKKDTEFRIGEIAFRASEDGLRRRLCRFPKPGIDGNDFMRMDWALCRVTEDERLGKNVHRYQQIGLSRQLDYNNEDTSGKICESSCPLEPAKAVHYVGRTSGLRRGRISTTRMLISKRGQVTSEWYLDLDTQEAVNKKSTAGDSGAWVIEDSGNRVMAQLWGCSQGRLLVTPIEDVFNDIRDKTKAGEIRLPSRHWHPEAADEVCEVQDEPQEVTTGYKKLPRLPDFYRNIIDNAVAQPRVVEDASAPAKRSSAAQLTAIDPLPHQPLPAPSPASPVPSLTMSDSSSPDRSPDSAEPSRRIPPTPVQLDTSIVPEPMILDAADEADGTSPLSQEPEPLGEDAFAQAKRDFERAKKSRSRMLAENRRKMHSVRFLLNGDQGSCNNDNGATGRDDDDDDENDPAAPIKRDIVRAFTDRIIAMPKPVYPRKGRTFPVLGVVAAT